MTLARSYATIVVLCGVAGAFRLAPGVVRAQDRTSLPVREEQNVHGRPGWVLESDKLHVAILKGGGHIAEINLISADPKLSINPMFIPAGNGYMGHMVCFPNFGPASPEERQNGIGGHGEANAVDWQQTRPPQVNAQGLTFFYGAELPRTQYRIERAVSLKTGEQNIHVEEWVENLTPYDRPYNWDEHATFGAPFVSPGKTFFDVSGTKAVGDPRAGDERRTGQGQWLADRAFDWPRAPAPSGSAIDVRMFRAVAGGQVYTSILADPSRPSSWFTLYNTDYPLLVGYVFPTAEHPWIVDWQNLPQGGAAGTARGIEFGTSPIDEGLRKSVERAQLLGTATYKFIAAKQRLSSTFTIFLAEIPGGFRGVRDVRIEDGHISFVERQ
jgi:hypothetical protein